jgi:hypothetical protein
MPRDYADRVNALLVLIDSPELAALMIEHDCGVIVEESFVLKRMDENFFQGSLNNSQLVPDWSSALGLLRDGARLRVVNI